MLGGLWWDYWNPAEWVQPSQLTTLVIETSDKVDDALGTHYLRTFDVTLTNSYPTGGYVITPSSVGLQFIAGVDMMGGPPVEMGIRAWWDTVNGKLMCGQVGQAIEFANGQDLTPNVLRLLFVGI